MAKQYYSSCDELPLYNFIKLATGAGMKWLMINPKSKVPADIQEIWTGILEEYSALCGDQKTAYMLSLSKGIAVLANKLSVIHSLVDTLTDNGHSKELCEVLTEMGFRHPYTPDSITEDLKRVLKAAKMLHFQLIEVQQEQSNLNASDNSADSTEADFYTQILHLSKFLGYKIDPKVTSVMEFAITVDQFNKANTPKKK